MSDPRLIEMLLERARQEIEETNQQWKQKPHIMALLEPEVEAADPWDPEEFRRLCVARAGPFFSLPPSLPLATNLSSPHLLSLPRVTTHFHPPPFAQHGVGQPQLGRGGVGRL